MKEQILEISDKLKKDVITPKKAQRLLLVLFGVIKRSIKLTVEQEERIDKFWDRCIVNGLMTSNLPSDYIEHNLLSILSIKQCLACKRVKLPNIVKIRDLTKSVLDKYTSSQR